MIGAVGTVRSCYCGSISVKLDDFTNNRGSTGCFYLSAPHLEPLVDDLPAAARFDVEAYSKAYRAVTERMYRARIFDQSAEQPNVEIVRVEKEETPMLKNYRAAGIKFMYGYDTDKTYPYALYDEDIVIGDTVVVMTGHHGMAIAEVCSIGEMPKDSVTCGREIICKVDMAAYLDRKARAKQMAELKKEMDEKVKALQETALYELMAEKDPSLKAMLEQFKALEA